MRCIDIDDRVSITVDVPEHGLSTGQRGVVCSRWNMPDEVLEIEVVCQPTGEARRALLRQTQLRLLEGSEELLDTMLEVAGER